jgi:hypothetical protein
MNLDLTDPTVIVIAVGGVVIVVVALMAYMLKHTSSMTGARPMFGPDHMRTLLARKSDGKPEVKLAYPEKRLEKLKIRELNATQHERFSKQWKSAESRFTDSPKRAVMEADDLVGALMKARGYPLSDFDQRAAEISVDHPRIVENYRSAHETALRAGKDDATTEELRIAVIHYRSLFEELVKPITVERADVA